VAGLALVALLPASGAAAKARHNDPKHKVGRGTSTNWSGYAVDAANATNATDVVGSWVQPGPPSCKKGESSWSSPWVGIDGDNSSTVEQIGTDTDCNRGKPFYYAWYEMYPKSLVQITSVSVQPGDHFTAEVTYTGGGNYAMTLNNATSGQSFSTTQNSTKPVRSSLEWVMEGPSNGTLTNFGSVTFTGAQAAFNNAALSNLGSFGAAADPITMVTKSGIPRAVPTSPLTSPDGFTVTWNHS
jgi:peptidase A4-like protein